MKNLSAVQAVFDKSDDMVAVVDCAMKTVWTNNPLFSVKLPEKLLQLADSRPVIMLPKSLESVYPADNDRAFKVTPLFDGDLVEGYLLHFYNVEDVQKLVCCSGDSEYRDYYLGNIRRYLISISDVLSEYKLKSNIEKNDETDIFFDEIYENVRDVFASTVNYEELMSYYGKPFKRKPINISKCMEKLLVWTSEKFEKAGAKLIYSIEPVLLYSTDWQHLEAAVLNLIVNGFLYSNAKEKEVRVTVRNEYSLLRICVEDNGTSADLPLINKFAYSAHRDSLRTNGEMLGLFIAYNFAKASEGWLKLKLTENGGLSAALELPESYLVTSSGEDLSLIKRADVFFDEGENTTRILGKAKI